MSGNVEVLLPCKVSLFLEAINFDLTIPLLHLNIYVLLQMFTHRYAASLLFLLILHLFFLLDNRIAHQCVTMGVL